MNTQRRGRPSKIGFDQIVGAALKIGLRDLTMTGLARELGVAMSTLYHHVGGIDEVNSAVADRLIADVDVLIEGNSGQELQAFLIAVGTRLREKFIAAPGLAEIARRTPRLQGRILAVHEKAARQLVELGLAPYHAFLTIRTLADYVESTTARDELWTAEDVVSNAIEQNRIEADAAGFSTMTDAYDQLSDSYLEDQFQFGLEAVASGLARSVMS